VRDPIPSFRLPLLAPDQEPLLDVGAALREVYERGGVDLVLNYAAAPEPPLTGEDAAWADQLLRARQANSAARSA
jgi:hypothetical protein